MADLILRARLGELSEGVAVEGVCEFRKEDIELRGRLLEDRL